MNIFISYNRQTKAITKALVDDVEALGHTVWFDQELSGGQVWWDQILSMVRRCDLFVFVLDPAALNSVACKREYGYAADLRKPILPILVSDGVSTNLLPPALSQIEFVDYRNQDRTAALRLARAFGALPPPTALPDPLPVPPEAPLSYLGSLAAKLETTSPLTYEEQSALVFDLKKTLRDPETADDTRTLLKTFRKRRDLLAGIAEEIDALFAGSREALSASPRASGMTLRFLRKYQKEETAPRPSKEEPQRQKTRGPFWKQSHKEETVSILPGDKSETQKARNPVQLLIVIVLIVILAALAVPALMSARGKAQMTGTMNNARQLYLAQFQMENDGAATGDASLTWPGDHKPALGTLQAYANTLVGPGYLKGADIAKLLNAPNCNFSVTVADGPPETVTFTGGTAALKIHPLRDVDPSNTIFCSTKNYDYDTALVGTRVPYGTKGFIVVHKGGDSAVFKESQATLAGWGGPGNKVKFQNTIGAKTGEAVGTVTPGDPAGTLEFP